MTTQKHIFYLLLLLCAAGTDGLRARPLETTQCSYIDFDAPQSELLTHIDAYLLQVDQVVSDSARRLRSEKDPGRKAAICYFLGQMRSGRGVDDLLNEISFSVDSGAKNALSRATYRWSDHPAAEALIEIGNPSLSPVLSMLGTTDDPAKCEAAISVITAILSSSCSTDVSPVEAKAKAAVMILTSARSNGNEDVRRRLSDSVVRYLR